MCKDLIEIASIEQAQELSLTSGRHFILGGGSNVAFIDDFIGSIITFTGKQLWLEETAATWRVTAEAGLNWHQLVNHLVVKGIGGLENLALIPGNCGAAPVQNIGAYGCEFSDFCERVDAVNLKTRKKVSFSRQECEFGYRNSLFKQAAFKDYLIVSITLSLPKKWQPNLHYSGLADLSTENRPADVMQRVIAIRQSKLPDPRQLPNAGSFFKNPIVTHQQRKLLQSNWPDLPYFTLKDDNEHVKLSAGWLIEKAGFKGKRRGHIGTYNKHALVIVNHGLADGAELLAFIREVHADVDRLFGVKLDNEVLLMGKEGLVAL